MAIVQTIGIQVYEVYCSKCRKLREVRMSEAIVRSKDIDSIECICGNKLSIIALKYLFRTRGYMEDRLNYFVS